MWRRVQGEGTVYTLTSRMPNWAEMDKDGDPAGKDCRMKVVNLIMPHVKSAHYNIAGNLPKVSTDNMPEDTKLVWVWNVKTSSDRDFMDVIGQVSATMKKVEGTNRGIWYSLKGGSPEVADFFIAVPYDNFASLDVDREGVWTIYEKEHGKEKTEALRAKLNASIESDWSYMYSLVKDLSF